MSEFLRGTGDALDSRDGVHVGAYAATDAPAATDDRSIVVDAIERVVALVVLVVALPVMLLIAVLVRLDSPGPALFRQPRVGRNGKIFHFYKFRTLYVDARERFPELYAYRFTPQQITEFHFKIPNDPRVTKMGRWLRQSTLDELPNFWNVVTGDMALVGPRPEIPEMLPYYHGAMLRKFDVRPGVTGLAQISGRGRLSFQQTVEYDLEYVQRRSLAFDVRIVLETLYSVIRRDGAF